MEKTGRFDYVAYDKEAKFLQEMFKHLCEDLEGRIGEYIQSPRARALALTKLEEMYMWIGKGVRDDQIKRGGDARHMPERTDG